MSYDRLPKERIKSLLLLYPALLIAVFWISGRFEIKKVIVVISVYILTVLLNIINLNFLMGKVRFFRALMIEIGIKAKRRLLFLLLGLLVLFAFDGRINFLYQIIYIAVFISTDTYIAYLGERYRQLFGKE